jgi:hypothetical protein
VELDGKGLGRLRRVANPRDVWTSEAGDFTPWLAQNVDVLADALGMSLTVIGTEVAVGDCRLDIKAEDDEGRVVVIENQLERTDHGHLGQCLIYASGLDAATVVWVSPQFRDDFRRALDWLNERTDLGVNFFGVEVGVVQIGDEGPRAPVFEVVARPNDWQKTVKTAGAAGPGSVQGAVSPLNAQRQDFFAEVMADVIAQHPTIRMPARSRQNWLSFASGPFGYWALSAVPEGKLRVEAYLDTGDREVTKELFDDFANDAEAWEVAVGSDLRWERLDEKRASRIAIYHPFALDDDALRDETRTWAARELSNMFSVLNEPLRTRAKVLRELAAAKQDAAMSAAHDAADIAASPDGQGASIP